MISGFFIPQKKIDISVIYDYIRIGSCQFLSFFFGCIETYQNRLWNNYNLYNIYRYTHSIHIYSIYIYVYIYMYIYIHIYIYIDIHIVEKTYSSISLQNHEAVGSRPSRPGRPRLRNSWRRSALAAVSWRKSMGNSLVEWIRKTKVFFFFRC